MRDGQHSATGECIAQQVLNKCVRPHVDRCSRLIGDEHAAPQKQGSGEAEQLALTCGQGPLRSNRDIELQCWQVRRCKRLRKCIVRKLVEGIQVEANCAVHEDRILGDHRDGPAQALQVQAVRVDAVQKDRPCEEGSVDESEQARDEGALSCAGSPDDADAGAARDLEREAVQSKGQAFSVAQAHLSKFDGALPIQQLLEGAPLDILLGGDLRHANFLGHVPVHDVQHPLHIRSPREDLREYHVADQKEHPEEDRIRQRHAGITPLDARCEQRRSDDARQEHVRRVDGEAPEVHRRHPQGVKTRCLVVEGAMSREEELVQIHGTDKRPPLLHLGQIRKEWSHSGVAEALSRQTGAKARLAREPEANRRPNERGQHPW
mmetsp:Transcript_36177/g.103904  ORF Transcript_36177/g.103904 Transcript_36177/m.103904 type:complete len:377 (+) Transcript_36177:757-1887(+)